MNTLEELIERGYSDYPDFMNDLVTSEQKKIAEIKFAANLAMVRADRLLYDSDLTPERRDKIEAIWEILNFIVKV